MRRLIMNRPKSRNALSEEMITALSAALDEAESDAQTRVIVVAYANGPVFSAGHDLKELNSHRNDADKGEAFFSRIFTSCSALMTENTDALKNRHRRNSRHSDSGGLPVGRQLRLGHYSQ